MSKRRRLLVPEIVQTSSTDCGPAALAAALQGLGVRASYPRLREACQTAVDGTSIAALAAVARQLGVDAEEALLPIEHLLEPDAAALPAIVVTRLPAGLLHFVVAWRTLGPFVQVMDPDRGRLWLRKQDFLAQVATLPAVVRAADHAEFCATPAFRGPLVRRLRALGVARAAARVARAAERGADALAALDAAARASRAGALAAELRRGAAAALFEQVLAQIDADAARPPEQRALAPAHWSALPLPEAPGMVVVQGAVTLQLARRERESAAPVGGSADEPALRAVLAAPGPGALGHLLSVVRESGLARPAALAALVATVALGALLEAVALRALFELPDWLPRRDARALAMALCATLVGGVMCLELCAVRGFLAVGRRVELGLRRRFLSRLPRLSEAYFRSRAVADLAERAHALAGVRSLPDTAAQLLRAVMEAACMTAGIVWLHPRGAPLAIGLLLLLLVLPAAISPALAARDMSVRNHAGALGRYYLDALRGLHALRAHGAEGALVFEHAGRLLEWARASRLAARTAAFAGVAQLAAGFAFSAWLVTDYLREGREGGWALLLLYWGLGLPAAGQTIGFLAQQLPRQRSLLQRLIEPLDAPVSADEAPGPAASEHAGEPASGVAFSLRDCRVLAGGSPILSVDRLDIAAGAHVAVVGRSGSGKTTLAGLLLGWHEPARLVEPPAAGQEGTAGVVLADGRALCGRHLQEIRRAALWVDPDVYLWNHGLLANLRYGNSGVQGAAPGEAVELAELEDLLGRLPEGMQTPLGEGGGLLSGGEGQRVRLGRGFLRQPVRLVVLDEAFRGLERARRQRLLRRVRARARTATVVCVTHDVADTLDFDRVLVVEAGRIVEDGSPGALALRAGSRYGELLAAEAELAGWLRQPGWRRLRLRDGRLGDDDQTPSPQPRVPGAARGQVQA